MTFNMNGIPTKADPILALQVLTIEYIVFIHVLDYFLLFDCYVCDYGIHIVYLC